jgi:hypothetical protein
MTLRRTHIRVLAEPITNPKPDGRKNDWTGAKQFPAGRYIVDDVSIKRVNGGQYNTVFNDKWRGGSKGDEQYATIIANSSEVAPHGIKELLLTLGSADSATHILGLLLLEDKITADLIERAALTLDEADEAFWNSI